MTVTPNKEIIRRICLIHGGTHCFIAPSDSEQCIDILANIETDKLDVFTKELHEWTGMNYRVYSTLNKNLSADIDKRITQQILPIQ